MGRPDKSEKSIKDFIKEIKNRDKNNKTKRQQFLNNTLLKAVNENYDVYKKFRQEAVAILLQAGADPNYNKGEVLFRFLHWSPRTASPFILEMLLRAGADPNKHYFNYPLFVALENGRIEYMKILLDYGADPNIKTDDMGGQTPLHLVANKQYYDYSDFVKLLLKYGADPFIKDKFYKLPIDYCHSDKNKACKLLKEVMDQSKLLQIYGTKKGHSLNKFPTDLGPKIFNYMFGLRRSKIKRRSKRY